MDTLIPIATAARKLGCHPAYLRKKCADGTVPALMVGQDYRVQWSDVLAWASHKPAKRKQLPVPREGGPDLLADMDEWISYLTHVKALSPNTNALYQTLMRKYMKRLAALGDPPMSLAALFDRQGLMKVFAQIPARSFNTKNNTFIMLRSFGQYLATQGKLDPATLDALKPLKPRRQSEPRRTHLKAPDVMRLFDVIMSRKKPMRENVTLAAMVGCMVYAGLRVSEVCNLRAGDVDRSARVLTVRWGKGGKDRRVGISSALLAYLDAYEAVRPRGALYFVDPDGRPWDRTRLGKRLQRASRDLDIDITCHGLRRTFATLAASQGRNIDAIRIALGHMDISTTQQYLRTSEVEVIESMKGW